MTKFKFMLPKSTGPAPFKTYRKHAAFLADIPMRLAELTPVTDVQKTLLIMRQDRSIFPIRKKGDLQKIQKWIRDAIIADYKYATTELSEKSTMSIELRHYHTIKSGLEIKTKIHTGEKGTGFILWLQIVVRLTDKDYAWWSHD